RGCRVHHAALSLPARAVGPAAGRRVGAAPQDLDAGRAGLAVDALVQSDRHRVTGFLSDRLAKVGLDRQLVGAIAHGHERAAERMTFHRASNLHEATGPEELDRVGHDKVGPTALVWALPQLGGELLLQRTHLKLPSSAITHSRP